MTCGQPLYNARISGALSYETIQLCSVMPDCIRANTNATAMMIGERLADLIAED